jgi:hypothetical protein
LTTRSELYVHMNQSLICFNEFERIFGNKPNNFNKFSIRYDIYYDSDLMTELKSELDIPIIQGYLDKKHGGRKYFYLCDDCTIYK